MITLLVFLLLGIYAANFTTHRLPSLGACFAVGMAVYVLLGSLYTMAISDGYPFHAASWLLAIGVTVHWFLMRDQFLPIRQRGISLPPGRTTRAIALFLIAAMALAVVYLFRWVGVPPANYDVLSYHIPLAQKFLFPAVANEVFWTPDIFYARLPLAGPLLEAPFVRGQYAGSFGIGVHLFIFATILAGAGCCARIAAWFGARLTGRLAAALLYMLHPLVGNSLLQAVLDPAVALMALASVELILSSASRQGSFLTAALAGLLLGTAFALKFSAAGIVVIPIGLYGIWCFALSRGIENLNGRLFHSLALGGGIFLGICFWLLRALAVGEHVAHPFAGEVKGWTKEQAEFVVQAHNPLDPLEGAYWEHGARNIGIWGYALPDAPMVSLLLVAALAAFAFRLSRRAAPLLVVAVVGYFFWLGVQGNPQRFLLPAVALMVLPAALLLDAAGRKHILLASVLIVLFAVPVVPHVRDAFAFRAVYSVMARDHALNEYLGSNLMTITREARKAAEENTVLLFFEARATLLVGNVDYTTVWDQPLWAGDLKASETPKQFLDKLRERGYVAIFVNEFEWGRLLEFYAQDRLPAGSDPKGRVGIYAPIPEEERMAALRAFPPHRFAGFDERDLTVLRDFLLACRQRTFTATPAGEGAEIWFAKLPESFISR